MESAWACSNRASSVANSCIFAGAIDASITNCPAMSVTSAEQAA